MTSRNKILTVSYGTFSCTLEGYDDALDTVTALAEYFRELADRDRHFGAKPSQPDPDIPGRMAGNDSARRMQATSPLPDAGSALAPAPRDVADDDAASFFVPGVTDDNPIAPPDNAPVSENRPAPDSAAARLQRIRAVSSASDALMESYSEDEHAEAINALPDNEPGSLQTRAGDPPAFDRMSADEDELDRLMAAADLQMDAPENVDRRSAFVQMRGAVAATRADGKLAAQDTGNRNDYRTDLDAVVRPRTPRSQQSAPPLKLVASQRIDMHGAPSKSVTQRDTATPTADECQDYQSFADYAARCGAQDLSDLVEAAATYLCYVEGREQFSRPQLLDKIEELGPDAFSREDAHRHVGQLLRAGKIKKGDRGSFTAGGCLRGPATGKRASG